MPDGAWDYDELTDVDADGDEAYFARRCPANIPGCFCNDPESMATYEPEPWSEAHACAIACVIVVAALVAGFALAVTG